MTDADSRVTIHMVASLDGFIARKDGSVDWLETSDEFEGGEELSPEYTADDDGITPKLLRKTGVA